MATPALTAEELRDLLGPDAASWPTLGLTVTRGALGSGEPNAQVQVWQGDAVVGYTEESDEFPGRRVYRAVITTDSEADHQPRSTARSWSCARGSEIALHHRRFFGRVAASEPRFRGSNG
ncbi:hypothetical protein [Saccharopolyspora pogona]|uniref:hypothetical protein n=1 Tax=Saccharopolyspora pogona TaxID=333966 RepID=UPI001683AD45|nr:hypothetical protein [Saccharopolyspora pogona]